MESVVAASATASAHAREHPAIGASDFEVHAIFGVAEGMTILHFVLVLSARTVRVSRRQRREAVAVGTTATGEA